MDAQVPHIATLDRNEAFLDAELLDEVRANHEQACRELHARFLGIARERGRLDALELDAIVEACELQVWKLYAQPDLRSYLEEVCGYTPRMANERERVSREILDLPAVRDALEDGLHYTKARELVRVATRDTEAAWLEAARDLNARQVEQLVAGHKKGDLPTDPPRPLPERRMLCIEVSAETYARFRQGRAALSDECGETLDDEVALDTMIRRALEGVSTPPGRPAAQLAYTLCPRCEAATVDGAGIVADVDRDARARALCDAEDLGDLDADEPERVTSRIPPRKRRQVFARDHHRCVVPGCRAGRCLDVHHVDHLEDGGTHDVSRLALVCHAHHLLHHRGKLEITGRAPRFTFRRIRPDDRVEDLGDYVVDADPRGSA